MGNFSTYSKGSDAGVVSLPEMYKRMKMRPYKREMYSGGSTPGVVEGYSKGSSPGVVEGYSAAVVMVPGIKVGPTKATEYSIPTKSGRLVTVKNGGSSPGVVG